MKQGPSAYRSIPGWLSDNEAQCLFDIVRRTPGNVSEAGTFYGKSTSVLCEGMLASGQSACRLVSYDLSTTSERQFREFVRSLGHVEADIMEMPPLLVDTWKRGTSSSDEAWKYLQYFNLDHLVELKVGDFRQDTGSYEVLFFDVMHGETEIEPNIAHVARLARPKAIVAFHDMYPDLSLKHAIEKSSTKLQFFRLVDTLGLFQRI